MTPLRRMRAEIPRPGADRLATGRKRLQTAIDDEAAAAGTELRRPIITGGFMTDTKDSSRNPVRRRRVLSVAVAAAAAVAVAATAVVADNIGDKQDGSADVARPKSSYAQKVLLSAAEEARKGPEPDIPRDDQFIYTKDVTKETERRTGKSKTYTDESWNSVDGSKHSWNVHLGEGNWTNPNEDSSRPPIYDWSELRKLPTDPVKLVLELCSPVDPPLKPKSLKGVSKEEWRDLHMQLEGIVLRAPVIPRELRATAFEALAMVPGIKAKPMKDAEGRPAVGIWAENALFEDSLLVLDKDSHKVVGHTGVRTPPKKTYDQFSHMEEYAIVDKLKQRP
ncbi:CU044_5270 family protein [Streptomyces sp. WMMB 714]|uniref:CU044_5270 family protein n=1 Tax=Streptomyces sp. WMMB 714 TaxID=1286822 RepID=UPI00069600A8|nr:CU044_5270 family protein [Streptomyces sp. WMMB 714]